MVQDVLLEYNRIVDVLVLPRIPKDYNWIHRRPPLYRTLSHLYLLNTVRPGYGASAVCPQSRLVSVKPYVY
jgi:hypothetical protein